MGKTTTEDSAQDAKGYYFVVSLRKDYPNKKTGENKARTIARYQSAPDLEELNCELNTMKFAIEFAKKDDPEECREKLLARKEKIEAQLAALPQES